MKRSEINDAITKAKNRLGELKISLPMFGYWTPEDWEKNKLKISRIKERALGWDVTDFGSNDFKTCGAVLFTVRNGDKNDKDYCAPYAEKYIVLDDDKEQQIPLHYHIEKTEDIINRAGGILLVQLYNKAKNGGIDTETDVEVYMDGVKYTVPAGEYIEINPGNSITLEPFVYHSFCAKKGEGVLIVGEVSKVNDDSNDNIFAKRTAKYKREIIEDESPLHLLFDEISED